MEKKRSKGVTFWGWVFIIFGAFGLLVVINPKPAIQMYGIASFFLRPVLSAVTFGCGIFILKLNETARKIAIISCLCSILLIPTSLKTVYRELNSEDYYNKQKQKIIQLLGPEYQQEALKSFEKWKESRKKGLPIMSVSFGISFLIIELLAIYFFTRPKVKEQFK